ncbi:MAG: PhzF family phenazine biosynthesis protein [Saprospiraceae bacterium]|nr:PhzF family phenazine biosynthesis protein [Saprospiraceae bacterium]
MERIKIHQVDAFTDTLFSGNPAAVCVIDEWLDAALMQDIAAENNLAETAFLVPGQSHYEIRWFTPTVEVDLCGHATLASALVLFDCYGLTGDHVQFHSPRSGLLAVRKEGDMLFLDFPTDNLTRVDHGVSEFSSCIGIKPIEVYKGKTDYIAVVQSEADVRTIQPNFQAISRLDARGLIVTAPGDEVDFVSRFFAPQSGVPEDPVTGSAHTSLTPLWSTKLGKTDMSAKQLSARGGALSCRNRQSRCHIGGHARLYLVGEINTR